MRHTVSIIITLSLILNTACSIKYSFTGASIPPGTETVSIAEFPNMAALVNPMLSNVLTEALKDKFMTQTSLQLVQQNGHLQFEGTIVDYNTKPMAIQAGTDQAAQNRLTITIKVKFVNEKDPKANFDTQFSRYEDYSSDQNLQDVEDSLIEVIVEQLVDDIFNKAVVNW
ncbi:MAG: LPS assembly lipoprotein LptE [Salinivirgaceae bacterium]